MIRPPTRFQKQVTRTTKATPTRTKTIRPNKKRGPRKIRLTAPRNRLTSRKTPKNKRDKAKLKRRNMKFMSTQTKM